VSINFEGLSSSRMGGARSLVLDLGFLFLRLGL
jgi:hypothetical protein